MTSATLDHMISLTVFIAAMLLFIGLFNQTISTAIVYQQHRALSTKTSDILDNMLLNPGTPLNWGQTDNDPVGFGLQDPEFTQYMLSPFSLMRLASSGQPVYYPRTDTYYNNITGGFGSSLLVPFSHSVNYSKATELLGIKGTYGLQLTLTPLLTVTVSKASVGTPLKLDINVAGQGFPLANAPISYRFLLVNGNEGGYPSFTTINNVTYTNEAGLASITFPNVNGESSSYALIAYAHLSGLKGVGYYTHKTESLEETVVPLVESFENKSILIAHGWAVGEPPEPAPDSILKYNSTFFILTDEFEIRQIPLDLDSSGQVVYSSGSEQDFSSLNIPCYNSGILAVTYEKTGENEFGVVLMPWGINSMAFPVTFGGNPKTQEWAATDIRQITIGGISYQAKLSLWSVNGYQVMG
jgi:hypothetical protein